MSTLLDQLQAIRDQYGRLDDEAIVETAADPDHPLHSRFDWDDSVAGHKWRLEQAGKLLRAVHLPPEPGRPEDLRAFMRVQGEGTRKGDYVPTQEAMADEFTRKLVLRDMEREWRLLKRRYEHMKEFAAMVAADMQGEVS